MMLSLRYFILKVPVHLILGQYFFCVSYWFIFVITTSFLKSSLWGLHLYTGYEVNTLYNDYICVKNFLNPFLQVTSVNWSFANNTLLFKAIEEGLP